MKPLLWGLLLVGQLPSLVIVLGSFSQFSAARALRADPEYRALSDSAASILLHDSFIRVGPLELRYYPRLWAALVLCCAAAFMIVTMAIVLHVPGSQRV